MEKAVENRRGTLLELRGGITLRGIREVVLELEPGGGEVLVPKMREEFGAYELHEVAVYVKNLGLRLGGMQQPDAPKEG